MRLQAKGREGDPDPGGWPLAQTHLPPTHPDRGSRCPARRSGDVGQAQGLPCGGGRMSALDRGHQALGDSDMSWTPTAGLPQLCPPCPLPTPAGPWAQLTDPGAVPTATLAPALLQVGRPSSRRPEQTRRRPQLSARRLGASVRPPPRPQCLPETSTAGPPAAAGPWVPHVLPSLWARRAPTQPSRPHWTPPPQSVPFFCTPKETGVASPG